MDSSAELYSYLPHFKSNLSTLVGASSMKAFPVIKADAYGHGAVNWAQILEAEFSEAEAPYFCVARSGEARELRDAGVSRRLLILSDWRLEEVPPATSVAVRNLEDLKALVQSEIFPPGFRIHLHFNTGMNRLGLTEALLSNDEFWKFLKILFAKGIPIAGLMSHLACADEFHSMNEEQSKQFDKIASRYLAQISRFPIDAPDWFHLFNSEAMIQGQKSSSEYLNSFRPGILLWGPSHSSAAQSSSLLPVDQVSAPVLQIIDLKKGQSLGYGASFVAKENMTVTTLGIGYADGVRRDSGQFGLGFFYRGKKCPIVGRISMDMLAVQVSHLDDLPKIGEHLYWICKEQSAVEIAQAYGTIVYEVYCSFSSRLKTRIGQKNL